jgi:hypothetical protein
MSQRGTWHRCNNREFHHAGPIASRVSGYRIRNLHLNGFVVRRYAHHGCRVGRAEASTCVRSRQQSTRRPIEEDPFDPKGKQDAGSVIWRTETLKPAVGSKPDIAVRADIDIPDRDFKTTMLFRRNTDNSLPATRVIELIFALPPDFAGGGIANVPGMTMKLGEQTLGKPLSGVVVKVTDSFFMMGLSNEGLDRNLKLLKERSWFDITLFYVSGRRAILAVEKGAAGEQAFADAFSAWAASEE